MRVTLYEPSGGADSLTTVDVHCALMVAGVQVPVGAVLQWTAIERLIAYDWAIREHLHASDVPVRRRELPQFVRAAGDSRPQWSVYMGGEDANDSAAVMTFDDEAEARETLQWIRRGGLARRTVTESRWVNVTEGGE